MQIAKFHLLNDKGLLLLIPNSVASALSDLHITWLHRSRSIHGNGDVYMMSCVAIGCASLASHISNVITSEFGCFGELQGVDGPWVENTTVLAVFTSGNVSAHSAAW